jgi:hypothetical protein
MQQQQQVEWRRAKVLELMSKGSSSITTATAREEGLMEPSLQQIPSTPDSFKNNNNKTILVSAAVSPLPGGITMSMTGQIKNTSKDTLRFLTDRSNT